jgi:hypothetical protein
LALAVYESTLANTLTYVKTARKRVTELIANSDEIGLSVVPSCPAARTVFIKNCQTG